MGNSFCSQHIYEHRVNSVIHRDMSRLWMSFSSSSSCLKASTYDWLWLNSTFYGEACWDRCLIQTIWFTCGASALWCLCIIKDVRDNKTVLKLRALFYRVVFLFFIVKGLLTFKATTTTPIVPFRVLHLPKPETRAWSVHFTSTV